MFPAFIRIANDADSFTLCIYLKINKIQTILR